MTKYFDIEKRRADQHWLRKGITSRGLKNFTANYIGVMTATDVGMRYWSTQGNSYEILDGNGKVMAVYQKWSLKLLLRKDRKPMTGSELCDEFKVGDLSQAMRLAFLLTQKPR